MKASTIFLSFFVAFAVLSWVNAHYDPSNFENQKVFCKSELQNKEIKL